MGYICIDPLSRFESEQLRVVAMMIRKTVHWNIRRRNYFQINESNRGCSFSYSVYPCKKEPLNGKSNSNSQDSPSVGIESKFSQYGCCVLAFLSLDQTRHLHLQSF